LEDIQLALTNARVDQKNFGLWLKQWQVGQVLNALVTGQRASGDLVLRVAGQQITATADIPIQQGARLTLEVHQLSPVPLLRVLQTSVPSATGADSVSGLLRAESAGPTQSLAQSLTALSAAAQSGALPAPLIDLLQRLVRQVSTPQQLVDPVRFRDAVRASGIFHEAHLQQGAQTGHMASVDADTKATLLRFRAALQAPVGEVAATQQGAARAPLDGLQALLDDAIQVLNQHQLRSQPTDASATRCWSFPVLVQLDGRYGEWNVQIERESSPDAEVSTDPVWRIALALALPHLGDLEVVVRLRGQQVTVDFKHERESVRQALSGNCGALSGALNARGMALQAVRADAPRREEELGRSVDARFIVDVTA